MFGILLTAALWGASDTVRVDGGQTIDRAAQASLAAGRFQTKAATANDAERYTVQVFAGKRADANAVYVRLSDSIGADVPVVIHFDEPQFKVFVGIYGSKIEAEHALRRWRGRYPTSFAVVAPNQRFKKGSSVR